MLRCGSPSYQTPNVILEFNSIDTFDNHNAMPDKTNSSQTISNKIATVLPDLLGEVILEHEGQAVFDSVELLRQGFIKQRLEPSRSRLDNLREAIKNLDSMSLDRVIHAYSTFFHLANIAEEYRSQQQRADLEKSGEVWSKSFLDTVKNFKKDGKTLNEVMDLVSNLHYYPTFTAHPTEAKRPLVLEALQRIHKEYQFLMNNVDSELDETEIKHRLKAMIQIFWKTE